MVKVVTPSQREQPPEAEVQEVIRNAHGIMMPLLKNLPKSAEQIFTDPEARRAIKALAVNDPQLLEQYFETVRVRCKPADAHRIFEIAGDFYTASNEVKRTVVAASDLLIPILSGLPESQHFLLTDTDARAAMKTLAQNDPGLFTTYLDLVRTRCSKTIARIVADLVGGALPTSAGHHHLHACSAGDLVGRELPQLELILAPWLFQKNLCMVHAKRGVGKTHLALAVAFAVASGGTFLTWRAPKPRGVLYIDGEMPAQLMQARLRELMSGDGVSPDLLRLVTPDLQDAPMPDLGTAAGQRQVDALVDEETALIIVDNLSCLVRSGGAENESESWNAVAEWALSHRRAGRAVLFVHHSGKSGAQRGTSKREDLLDVVINLKHPGDYSQTDGAVFIVEFEKARSLNGDSVEPIEARLETMANGSQVWTHRSVESVTNKSIIELWEGGGVTLTDIARELGMNKSTAHRHLKDAMASGELSRPYPSAKGKAGK